MSNLITKRWAKYVARKSKWGIALDFLFVFALLLLIIPQSRTAITGFIIRNTLFQPRETKEVIYLPESQLQWSMVSQHGDTITLKELQGKVLFINLWATWCPPCVAEMPSIAKLHEQWKDKVVFLLINDEDPDKVSRFMSERGLNLPVYRPIGTTPELLNSESIPATFIVTPNHRIVLRKIGAADWNGRRIHKILSKYTKANVNGEQ